MKKNTLLITLVAAGVLFGVGVMMDSADKPSAELSTDAVLPDLATSAASIDRIKIETAGNTLVVESHKQGEQWLIDNLGNYTAQTTKLSTLINSLKDAKKVEAKTTREKNYHHLGLRDVSDSESKATLVTLTGGGKSYQLLVGDSAKNGAGQYVRLAGDKQTWLIDKSITKPSEAEDWVNTKLFEFTINDVQSLTLTGRFAYSLTKENKESANFVLDAIPETHKIKYDSVVDSVPRSLSNLSFEALTKVAELPPLTDEQNLMVKLFDKEQPITVKAAKSGEGDEAKYYVQLTGDNLLWNDWAYQVSEYNYNQLAKDKMDFLDEQEPSASEEPSAADEPASDGSN